MVSRQESKKRQQRRKKALLRYQKEKWRNQAASPGIHDFILVLDHLKAGFNIPKIFRSAEAFGAREIHLVAITPFDPAPAKGAFRKVPAHYHDSFRDCYESLRQQGYSLFIQNHENTIQDLHIGNLLNCCNHRVDQLFLRQNSDVGC